MSEALLTETSIRLETDLRAIGARRALVGGLAVSVRSRFGAPDRRELASEAHRAS